MKHFFYTIWILVGAFGPIESSANAQFRKLVVDAKSENLKVVQIVTIPTISSENFIEFELGDVSLEPNEAIYIDLPAHIQAQKLDFVSVAHRQSPSEETECRGFRAQDCLPGLMSLEVLNKSSALNDWRYWGGRGSGPRNSKFAEVRARDAETDNLYEWQKKGHYSLSGQFSIDPIQPQALRIISLGQDRIHVHRVILKTVPKPPSKIVDHIFSREFAFGDYETSKGRHYPRDTDYGNYGSALSLNPRHSPRHFAIPSNWMVVPGGLQIPIEVGQKISFVDVAIGDMKRVPWGQNPEHFRGGAELNIELYEGTEKIDTLMNRENVGSNGVIRGIPRISSNPSTIQSFVFVSVPKGIGHVMGIRIGYK